MKELSVKRLIDNIYLVAKDKGVRIGDLEAIAKVSQGYFSRVRGKEDAASAPNIEIIAAVAEALGVTIDDLVYSATDTLTPNEKRVLSFVNKLLMQTKQYEIDWIRESIEEMTGSYSGDDDPESIPGHPLVEVIPTCADESVSNPDYIYYREYDSKFYREENCHVALAGDGFMCFLASFAKVYIEKVQVARDSSLNRAVQYELYLLAKGTLSPLCRSNNDPNGLMDRKLGLLYNAAAESTSHIQLDDSAKSVIDQYLSGKKIEYCSEDDDLPF